MEYGIWQDEANNGKIDKVQRDLTTGLEEDASCHENREGKKWRKGQAPIICRCISKGQTPLARHGCVDGYVSCQPSQKMRHTVV